MDQTGETPSPAEADTASTTTPPGVVVVTAPPDSSPVVSEPPPVSDSTQSFSPVTDITLEPVPTPPAPIPESAPLQSVTTPPTPVLPIIQVEASPPVVDSSSVSGPLEPEVKIVERVVEKIVEKEIIKEVPVEKIVEKIVYRDAPPAVCPPPTEEERDAINRDFLIELSHEGSAKKHELMLEKLATILTLFDTRDRIMHKDVMEALDCSSTTATRLLTELRHENKILLHGTGGNGAFYIKI